MKNLKLIVLLVIGSLLITACSCSKIKYTVSFDNDGKIEKVEVTKDDKVTPLAEPTKEGYTFDGWYLGENKYDFDSKVTKNITLTAKWTKNEEPVKPEEPSKTKIFSVTFESDGNVVTTKEVKKSKKVAKIEDPTKEGYKFIGWYLDGKLYNFNSKVTKDIKLVANWEKLPVISYSVEKLDGSSLGQVKIYVTKDGVKTDGYIDLVETDGTTYEKVSVKSTGLEFNEKLIKEIKNVKIK